MECVYTTNINIRNTLYCLCTDIPEARKLYEYAKAANIAFSDSGDSAGGPSIDGIVSTGEELVGHPAYF